MHSVASRVVGGRFTGSQGQGAGAGAVHSRSNIVLVERVYLDFGNFFSCSMQWQ